VIGWSDSTGKLLQRIDYDPFGNVVMKESFTANTNNLPLNFGFSSKYTDKESGFLYYGYRFYNPTQGRWSNRDPIEEQGGINVYGFVGNNGVNQIDVLGMFYPGTPYDNTKYGFSNSTADMAAWTIFELSYPSFPLAVTALNHADGSIPGDWTLDEFFESFIAKSQTERLAKHKATGKDFETWLRDEIYNKFYRLPGGTHTVKIPASAFKYQKPSDGYFAFGDANLSFDIEASVCKSVDADYSETNFKS
jgi:RHS repeat-associated protein